MDYDDFGKLAADPQLSAKRKVARLEDMDESAIFPDIAAKTSLEPAKTVLDIGCGCSRPTVELIEFCHRRGIACVLVDHPKMIQPLEKYKQKMPRLTLIGDRFPSARPRIQAVGGEYDVIICYSVLHYVKDMNIFKFVDEIVELLAPGGRLLLADLPNESKKQRFLATEFGREFHQRWSGGQPPAARNREQLPALIDDSVVLQLISRYRAAGFEAYVLPQPAGLPFCYSREDVLITRYPAPPRPGVPG